MGLKLNKEVAIVSLLILQRRMLLHIVNHKYMK